MTIAVVPVKELGAAKGKARRQARAARAPRARSGDAGRRSAALSGGRAACRRDRGHRASLKSLPSRARFGAEVLEEPIHLATATPTRSSTRSRSSTRRGEPAVLSVPGDVPAVTPEEIAQILGRSQRRGRPGAVARRARHQRRARSGRPARFPCVRRAELRRGTSSAHESSASLPRCFAFLGSSLDLDTPTDLDAFLRAVHAALLRS